MVLAVVSVNPGDRLRWTQNFPDSCSVQGSFGEMICVNPFSSLPFSPRWERLPLPRRPMSLQMRPVVDQLINVPVDDGPWVKAKDLVGEALNIRNTIFEVTAVEINR
jgi:hypothetical protein